jgi:hypothetical protein
MEVTLSGVRVAQFVLTNGPRGSIVVVLVTCCLLAVVGIEPSSDEILARVADTSSKRNETGYSSLRQYRVRNIRFSKEAVVSVQEIYRPGEGKQFTLLDSSGSPKLTAVVEKLLLSEAEASKPAKVADHEISPVNYQAQLRGTETTSGRSCFRLDLIPRHKSKYLLKGTVWVDRSSYGIVRLDGSTAASVSLWIGIPYITGEFGEISGLWLPVHLWSVSSGLLLGASELEIRYTDYRILNAEAPRQSVAAQSAGAPAQAPMAKVAVIPQASKKKAGLPAASSSIPGPIDGLTMPEREISSK